MKRFLDAAREDPTSLGDDNAAASEAFLASQIFGAVKDMLVFDDDEEAPLDEDASMLDLAVDLLMAIELQNWWRQSMGTHVSILELTNSSSAMELAKLARTRLVAELGG